MQFESKINTLIYKLLSTRWRENRAGLKRSKTCSSRNKKTRKKTAKKIGKKKKITQKKKSAATTKLNFSNKI
jgi:hypothetical protein